MFGQYFSSCQGLSLKMDGLLTPGDIKGLVELLKTPDQGDFSSSDDDLPKAGISKLGPGDIAKKVKVNIKGNSKKEKEITLDPLSIWDISEVPEIPYSDDAISDPRIKPELDIKFKQLVGSEDVFLQLSAKTPATSSCECMILTMILQDELKDDIDCHLTENHLDIRSPKYRLSTPLPHPVDPDSCAAEWDPEISKLTLNLTLKREYDYVNF